MIGASSAIGNLRRIIERLGPTNSRVLISGQSGAGKELTARLIHAQSVRADGPFVVLNAPAMTPDHMESELFGVEASTGRPRRVGALEQAHGGTLYLDEVADMPLETQAKILRVLVDQNFQRVGGVGARACRRAHHLVDQPRSRRGDHRRAVPRGSVPSSVGGADPRAVAGRATRRHPRAGRNISSSRWRRRWACRRAGSPTTPWRRCRRTTGPATSDSCATTSSG